MPYKDPEAKREWERQHRPQRLARRRELRRMETEQKEAQDETLDGVGFLLPLIAAGALAAYNPKLAMGTGGLTLAIAAIFKKGWNWWLVGGLIIMLGLFFYWSDQSVEKRSNSPE